MAGTEIQLIVPDWPAPPGVVAVSTTRAGGVSDGPFASLNLATHVGDRQARVRQNRALLMSELGLTRQPCWLNQVHGSHIVAAETVSRPVTADAAMTAEFDVACTVMTADCLPILLCDRHGSHVAALHGGWRGLASGMIAAAVATLGSRGIAAEDLMVWLGPAIGPSVYEVGQDVRDAVEAAGAATALTATAPKHWHLDLYAFARSGFMACGVENIHGGNLCTYSDPQRFFSYRRNGSCGRQATLIWRKPAG